MRDLLRPLMLIALVLLVPIVPFALWGQQFEAWGRRWSQHPPTAATTAAIAITLLATDTFLPVPSSLVNTLAGSQLGTLGGTLVCWIGMNLGAALGFALARYFGQPLARRLSRPEHLERMQRLNSRYGPGILIAFRAVPVLAEATVLLAGMHQLAWPRFLLPITLANLGIAFAYAAFGSHAAQQQWLPVALGVSLAIPLLLTAIGQAWLARRDGKQD